MGSSTVASLGYIADQETKVDLLRNEAISKVIVDLICRSKTSVTVGVHGDWGAGKSSVLHMLEHAFGEGSAKDSGSLCIRFNGWEFQGFEDAKIALIEGIVTQLVENRTLGNEAKALLKRILKSIDLLKVAKRAGGVAMDLAMGVPLMTMMAMAESFATNPGTVATAENARTALSEVRGVLRDSPGQASVPKELWDFKEAFGQLLKETGVKRLVVLVDDLDRCLPETAIQTLEAIRLFVSLPNTAFVIGADEAMIEYAVKDHFKDLPEDKIRGGYPRAYLEKLIQVPFRIPSLGEAETRIYVTMLLIGTAVGEDHASFRKLLVRARELLAQPWERKALSDDDLTAAFVAVPDGVARLAATADTISPVLAQGTQGNPRQIKRFINALNLRLAIAEARGFGDAIDAAVLAKFMLAEMYLPDSMFKHMATTAASSEDGLCGDVATLEALVRASAPGQADEDEAKSEALSTDGLELAAEWATQPEVVRWARVEPRIGKISLKPYLFVVNDRQNFVEGSKPMSAKLRALVQKLLGGEFAVASARPDIQQLDGAEVEQVFSQFKSMLLMEKSLSTQPASVNALSGIVAAHPAYQGRYVEVLEQLPPGSLGSWASSKFTSTFTSSTAVTRFEQLKARWSKEGGAPLRKAVEVMAKAKGG
ncbi:Qat anti-phage system ATPase QatA [Mesorhizobium sp. B2-4-6]|uniref:Qat anti-phage system ATPase QatA n=1 Tax=Mesorhizobium sp. B2-4-6 TaxID=2589943 RepID=UPI00112E05E7|nr:Qat anti-phage system ATPase QatA [Mesorhizobium sp. B2-4-6]TPL51518.1 NTPase KAP [Mesorhizobium sp. B2-4-6]